MLAWIAGNAAGPATRSRSAAVRVVTREGLRDRGLPLLQETIDATNKVIAIGVARLEARTAPIAFGHEFWVDAAAGSSPEEEDTLLTCLRS